MTPMSSVPVQLLIYVMPTPNCSIAPSIVPLDGCLEVTASVMKSFNISIINRCNPFISNVSSVVVSKGVTGMQVSNITQSSTNVSMFYTTFTWTPQTNQLGQQQLCIIAVTDEMVQSAEYCVIFTVIASYSPCVTTTTSTTTSSTSSTTTTSTSSSTTSTSTTTTTTSTTSTSTSTTSTTTTTVTTTKSARHRHQQQKEKRIDHDLPSVERVGQKTRYRELNKKIRLTTPNVNDHAYDSIDLIKNRDSYLSMTKSQTSAEINDIRVQDAETPFEIRNATIQSPNHVQENNSASVNHRPGVEVCRVSRMSKLYESNESLSNTQRLTTNKPTRTASTSPRKASGTTVIKLLRNKNVRAVSTDANSNKLDEQRYCDEALSISTNKTNQILIKSSKSTAVKTVDSSLKAQSRPTSLREIRVVKVPKSIITSPVVIDLLKE
ncbi:unnamed protein product [Adineta ricciae]|uniref:Uncharacterized protein n=1 Tax=Adineta ricciae TaxID=249248 RepID=A0A815MX42_ADIRI|nr:unnamed protein product [Adineta ricciae]